MSPKRTLQALQLFTRSLDLKREDRESFLDRSCDGDSALRAEVTSLMEAMDAVPESFLSEAVFASTELAGLVDVPGPLSSEEEVSGPYPVSAASSAVPPVLRTIGQYKLGRLIAVGGMGTVYEAEQRRPRRTVALKVMNPEITCDSTLLRFEYESQILARLRHPNIAQIFEAGTVFVGSRELPYFAMEYLPGAKPITEFARTNDLDTHERLRLFSKVCAAVHHGHQKGIIHRDIKPANVLIDSAGRPKVIDFGVARATDAGPTITTLPDSGQLLGTVQYMSPEQCAGESHDLDTRSDVYSLGVVLYELLFEKLPYDVREMPIAEALSVVLQASPETPSDAADRQRESEVDTIALKALAKRRGDRYQSASDLAADIDRHLNDEPILARPPTPSEKLRRLVRRHRLPVALAALALLSLTLAVILTTAWLFHSRAARQDAEMRWEVIRTASEFLNVGVLEAADLTDGAGIDLSVLQWLEQATEQLEGKYPDKPLVEATVRSSIGRSYYELSRYDEAIDHLTKARQLHKEQSGSADPWTLETSHWLGWAYLREGRREDAEAVAREVLEHRLVVSGPDHPDTLHSMNLLGGVFEQQMRYEEAEDQHRETLDRRSRVLGSDHVDTLNTAYNLALVLRVEQRSSEAEGLHRRVVSGHERTLGLNHKETLLSKFGLAEVLFELGRYDESRKLLEEILPRQAKIHGLDHDNTASTLQALALVLSKSGGEGAEVHFRNAAKHFGHALGEDHFRTIWAHKLHAEHLRSAGRFREAEAVLVGTLAALNERASPGQRALPLEEELIRLYDDWDKPAEAAALRARLSTESERAQRGR